MYAKAITRKKRDAVANFSLSLQIDSIMHHKMMFFLLLIPIFIAVLIDFVAYRHKVIARRALLLLLAIDTLPLWILLVGVLCDNTPTVMRLTMWAIWLWIALTLPRFLYALFAAIHLRFVGIATSIAALCVLVWGVVVGRKDLQVNEVEICSEHLPKAFDGYRIAHFSDLHLGTLVNTRHEVGQLVERLNQLQPDMVCFTGDLVNIRHSELDAQATRLLQGIQAPVLSVLGNHDVGSYIRDTLRLPREVSHQRLIKQQQQMGWLLLQDSTIYLHRGADSLSVTGLTFDPSLRHDRHSAILPLTGGEKAYQGVPDSLYNITLVHLPQLWEQIVALGHGHLTLAGHTHAMQLKLRFGEGRGWSPAGWMYDRWSGRYDLNGHTLYINDGIGYVGYPMRIGARPEITLYTLKRCE